MLTSDRSSSAIGTTLVKSLIAGVVLALAVLSLTPAAAFADGTINVKKGGDRNTGSNSVTNYASGLAGVRFEYTTDASKAANPASTGWTAFTNLTAANGEVTQTVPAGTYYIRENSVAAGFTNFGPVKSLTYDGSSNTPSSAQPYAAKVKVTNNDTVNAYPTRTIGDPSSDWNQTSNDWLADNTLSPFINVRNNQPFPNICGLNLLLVLDRSGSIWDYKEDYRLAARGLVDALSDTPTQIGITSFSAGDSGPGGTNSYNGPLGTAAWTKSPVALSDVGQTNENALKTTIDAIYNNPVGGTNWDAALQNAATAGGFTANLGTGQTTKPDVVVFITDGNPTARNVDGSDSGSGVDLLDLTSGMSSANLIKNQIARAAIGGDPAKNLKVYAVGVENDPAPPTTVNADSLKAVSGPILGEDYETPTIASLTSKLTELAARTCGARIYVRKRYEGGNTNIAGWNYTGSSTGGTQSYLDGNRTTHLSSGVIQTGVIVTKVPEAGANVTVTEDASGQPLTNFTLTNKVCRTGSYDGTDVTPVSSTSMGLTVAVTRGATLYCTFTNRPAAKLELRKQLSPTTDPGLFNLLADGASSDVTATNVGHNGTSGAGGTNVLPGSYALSETAGAGTSAGDYTMGAPSCVKRSGGSVTVTSGSISLAADDDVICTWTNTRNKGSIELKKAWVGTGGQTTLQIGTTAGGTQTDTQLTGANGAAPLTTGANNVNTGTYYVSESGGLTDYDSSLACTKNGSAYTPGANDSVVVGKDDVVVCTFTNTRKQGSIELKKAWVGTGGQTTLRIGTSVGGTQVDTQLTGANGTGPLTTGANTVNTGTYYVSESGGLTDYTTSLACTKNGNAYAPGANDSVVVGKNDVVVCTYTNTRKQGTVTLNKQWIGTPGQTTLQIGTTNGGSNIASVLTGAGGGVPQTTGTKTVDTGTYYVSESGGLTDYTSSLSCINNQAGSPDTDGQFTVALGDNWVCTYTNTRKGGSIELKKAWVGTGGQTTLNIGTSAGGSQTASQQTGADGAGPLTTGTKSVDTGTYHLSESGGLTDYDSTLSCSINNGTPFTPANSQVVVGANQSVVCTYTNTRKQGSIELKKAWVGTGGQTTLQIGTSAGGSQTDTQQTGANGAAPLTTGVNTVDTGTYYVSESGGLADYDSSLACTKNGNAYTPGANDSVVVGKNDTVVCTFTNTRKRGSIELKKAWVGTGGQTTLNIGTSAGGSQTASQQTGAGGAGPLTTGSTGVDTGTYYVSESGGLADYDSSLACTKNGNAYTPGANDSVVVGKNDSVVCTFTNSRKQGTVTLNKQWVGTPGQTTLQIGTTNGGSDVASVLTGVGGGVPQTTGTKTVNTGTYYVSESGGLTDYTSSLSCINNQAGSPDTDGQLTVAKGDNWVCTYTNTRKQASIELKKQWVGTGGQTTLNIGSSSGGTDVASVPTGANGGAPLTTTAKTVNTGTYYVSESGGLADYDSSLSCSINGGTAFTPQNNAVTVAQNEAAVCTFVNTRKQGSIELKKAWVGTGGQTTLNIGTSAGGSQTASQQTGAGGAGPLTTGVSTVDTGTYYVSESGGLADYDSSLACTKNGNAYTPGANDSVVVGKNDTVVCTYTNTRHTGTIKLVKHLIGGGSDEFNLKIDGVNQTVSPGGGTSFGHNDATAVLTKEIGSYAVSEAAVAPADLALYDRSLSCVNNGQGTPDTDGTVAIAKGDNWVCTFTNTKKAKVTVKKVTVPSSQSSTFGFSGTLAGAFNLKGADDPGTAGTVENEKTVWVSAGSYTAIEDDPSGQGYLLDSIVCDDTASTVSVPNRTATIVATSGGNVTCTFTNRKIDAKINVVKSPATQSVYLSGANSTATYNYRVTNPGTTPVLNVTVSDDKCASVVLSTKNGDSSPSTLDPGDVWDYTCSVSAATLFSGGDAPVTNTVTAAGKDELGGDVSDTDTAVTKLLKPSIGVVKSPANQKVYSDGTASYTYTVTNTGNTELTNVTISDDKCSPISAPDKTGDSSPGSFDPGDVWTYTCSVSAGTLFTTNDPVTNTVTVKGTEPTLGREVDDTDTAVTELLRPEINVDKTPASQTVNYGSDATYTYAVTNPGNTPLEDVTVSDDKCSPVTLDNKGGDASPSTLDPGDTWTYKCTVSAATLFGSSPSPDDSITNTATAKGKDTEKGREVEDDDTAETKLETGTLILEKDLTPDNDPGRFLLKHDGTAATIVDTDGSTEFGDGDVSNPIEVVAGVPVAVSEEAASQDHPLDNYVRTVTCIDQGEDSNTPTNILDHDSKVTVGNGQTVRCTFVNERKAKITVKKVVSNPEAGDGPEFGFQSDIPVEGWGSFDLHNGDSASTLVDAGKAPFTISEDDPSGIDGGYKLTDITCTDANQAPVEPDRRVRSLESNVDLDKRNVTITPRAGSDVTCVFTNKRIVGLDVVVKKPKSQAVYLDGTATYTYEVTNTGTSDLTDVHVTDDKCPNVTGPNTGSDPTPTVLNPGDTWTYTCSISAAELFGSTTAPITNTVTVTAKDELGRDVPPAKDTAQTTLLVPGIAIDKTVAPGQTFKAGNPVTFNIAVTDTGNTSFTNVAVGDDLCPANLSGADKTGDASPNTLDPGETWRYTCVVQTTASQAGKTLVNTATVEGTDTGGKKLTASDKETVQLPADDEGQGPEVTKKGSSRLRASSACVKTAYAQAAVSGKNIRSVTFYLNGKKVKTLTKRNAGKTFKVKFRTKSLSYGNYKVRAVVRYVTGAEPTRKTLSAQFNRCRPRVVVRPKFPG